MWLPLWVRGGESVDSAQASAMPTAVNLGFDPLYGDQWHLKNTGQLGVNSVAGVSGEDMNVEPAWASNYKGNGIRIAVVDEGLEIGHEDLAANVAANGLSHNYLTGSSDPTNDPADVSPGNGHGTAVAGIAAARDLNGRGGSGVAPRATLVGYNLLQNHTISNEVDAMIRNAVSVSVSSNSWGAADGTGELTSSPPLWQSAINTGLTTGRGGKGTVYMWAAGNGAAGADQVACPTWICSDNSNYDGRANYRGVMAVGAVNDQGLQSSYSESGANLWVAAPGGEFCSTTHAITTTDRTGAVGDNTAATAGVSDYTDQNYTKCMNGTSAATPGAAGVVALMLSANPSLGWRDVRIILAQSSRTNDPGTCLTTTNPCPNTSTGWVLNGTGTPSPTNQRYYFNHKYGFGVVDANAAVTAASTWVNVGPEVISTQFSSAFATPISVPDNNTTGVSDTITVAGSGIASIEWVEVTFSATHPYTGDLDVSLTSPSGMVSQLAVPHFCGGTTPPYSCTSSYTGWVFGSAAHLGETANGSWTLTVKDGSAGGTGTFDSWKLKFYGH
jgi:proprotein convertase subtilisin/kexin type 2